MRVWVCAYSTLYIYTYIHTYNIRILNTKYVYTCVHTYIYICIYYVCISQPCSNDWPLISLRAPNNRLLPNINSYWFLICVYMCARVCVPNRRPSHLNNMPKMANPFDGMWIYNILWKLYTKITNNTDRLRDILLIISYIFNKIFSQS